MEYTMGHGSGSGMAYITHFHESRSKASKRVSGTVERVIFGRSFAGCLLLLLVIRAEAEAKHMCTAASFVLYHEAGWLVRWLDGWMNAWDSMFYAGS